MSLLDAACIKTNDGTIHVAPNGTIGLPGLLTPDIPATDVVDIAVEDGKEASQRITATRVALIGVFALAAKKKVDATKFIVIETVDNAYAYEIGAKEYRTAVAFVKRAKVAVARGQEYAAKEAEEAEAPAVEDVDVEPSEPAPKKWWQKTTGDLINERRIKKGKKPINFNAA